MERFVHSLKVFWRAERLLKTNDPFDSMLPGLVGPLLSGAAKGFKSKKQK